MGRLLRFRAWDSNKNEMLTGDFIEDRHPEYRVSLAYGSLSVLVAATCLPLEPMQFTGLYDRHGAEIYEGDICNVKEYCRSVYVVAEVIWGCENGWAFRAYYNGKSTGDYYGIRSTATDSVEVIGNIYQHPHLLERP